MSTELEFDQIKTNWETFDRLCRKAFETDQADLISELLDNLGERASVCPASTKLDQYGAYPGGLIEHALTVTSRMRKLAAAHEVSIDVKSILRVGLLHELGKIGDLEEDLFVEQDSNWHREKLGQMYKYNEELPKMAVPHLTLFLLQYFCIQLTRDEWLAIHLSQGSHLDENRFYIRNEPLLAVILQQAKQMIILEAKNNDD
ncbi:MAG: hypothetical protein CME70_06095 [Halobacteriovorax sp.]|nr:hypothetical protein [Halobacteriovorax sp.]|tara:strand:+ start:179 stop:784 length:606 start_codon:yes stop_codon:yes gene_type:complete